MLQYVNASKLTTLAALAVLFALSFLIFGCGDDETPAPTSQAMPAPATVDVAAITAGVSAGLTATDGANDTRRNGEGAAASVGR